MHPVTEVQFAKSIRQRRLVFRQGCDYNCDRVFIYVLLLFCAICPFVLYCNPHRIGPHPPQEYWFFGCTAISLWVIYRKTTELRLRTIVSRHDESINRERLVSYLQKEGFNIHKNSGNIIVATIPLDVPFLNPEYCKCYVFLLKNNRIYFTLLRFAKVNAPVILSYYFLRYDLKKVLA